MKNVSEENQRKSMNPSSIRSRKLIINALFVLMQSYDFDSITISQICLQAQVVRKTFYRHFKNKEAVLDEYIEYLYGEYIKMLKKSKVSTTYEVTLVYFEFWKKYIPFLKILYKNDLLLLILKKYDMFLPQISQEFACKNDMEKILLDYANAYSSVGYWRLLCKWIERGCVESTQELARIHMNVIERLYGVESKS